MIRELSTERLLLRKPHFGDVEKIHDIHNSDFVQRYNVMPKLDKVGITIMLEKQMTMDTWVIEYRATGDPIGMIYKNDDSLRFKTNTCELSYWLGEDWAGQGIMAEALRAVISFLFDEADMSGITSRSFEDNERSYKLLEKLGFKREGRLENAVKSLDGVIHNDLIYYLKRGL